MKSQTHYEKTRKIYEAQHDRIVKNKDAINRIYGMFDDLEKALKIPQSWFEGKRVLDAGCGNMGGLFVKLVNLGCSNVTGIDIGTDWIPLLEKQLKKHNIPKSKYTLKEGNVLNMPFEDETFDFVAIDGVLVHLVDMNEIEYAFQEGVRVCKKGGYYYTTYGVSGGLLQGAIFPAVRKYYLDNPEFKKFIDNIHPELIHKTINKICADAKKYTGEDLNAPFLKSLFGEDFCAFLQNHIQAPTWYTNECSSQYIEGLYKKHGFKNILRLNKFIKRKDIRKYLAPLHYDNSNYLSKILYGEGFVKYIAQKI